MPTAQPIIMYIKLKYHIFRLVYILRENYLNTILFWVIFVSRRLLFIVCYNHGKTFTSFFKIRKSPYGYLVSHSKWRHPDTSVIHNRWMFCGILREHINLSTISVIVNSRAHIGVKQSARIPMNKFVPRMYETGIQRTNIKKAWTLCKKPYRDKITILWGNVDPPIVVCCTYFSP